MSNCLQISDASLAAIALSCPNLHAIQLRMCKKVTDVGVRGAWHGSWCTLLTLMAAIAEACRKLEMLVLGSNNLVTDNGIEAVAFNSRALKSVELWKLDAVTDNALVKLVNSCTDIRHLSLHGCLQVRRAAVLLAVYHPL